MKKLTLVILFLISTFSYGFVDARSGCCSSHGGVCGCGCCDGTSLSATCAPYYPGCSSGYNSPSYSYPSYSNTYTSSCPANSYESLGSCKCNSGYIVQGSACVNANNYCSSSDYNSEYDSISGSCKCKYGYLVKNNKCISQSSYCNGIDYNSEWDSTSKSCKCRYGYLVSKDTFGNEKCVTEDDYCTNLYGNYSEYNSLKSVCVCKTGYIYSGSKCVLGETTTSKAITTYTKTDCEAVNALRKVLESKYDWSIGSSKLCEQLGLTGLASLSSCLDMRNTEIKQQRTDIENFIDQHREELCNTQNCPTNSTLSSADNKCYCNNGYIMLSGLCITYSESCKNKYGNNTYGDKDYCYCNPGYKWDSNKTSCIEDITCPTSSILFGGNCKCLDGLELNSDKTACVNKNIQVNVENKKPTCKIGYKLDEKSNKCIVDVVYGLEQKAKSKGKEKIAGPSKMKLYKNIEKIGTSLWGNKK